MARSTSGKVGPKSLFIPPDYRVWNGMIEASEKFKETQSLGATISRTVNQFNNVDRVKAKLNSWLYGNPVPGGSVIEIGSVLTTHTGASSTNPTNLYRKMVFEGKRITSDLTKSWGLLARIGTGTTVHDVIMNGLVLARVYVDHPDHMYADVSRNSATGAPVDTDFLRSDFKGRARIIQKFDSGYGGSPKQCVLDLGQYFYGPIFGVTMEEIAVDGYGDVHVWQGLENITGTYTLKACTTSYSRYSVRGYLDWHHGGTSVANNKEVTMYYIPHLARFRITNAEC